LRHINSCHKQIVWSHRQASEDQPSEVIPFSYWLIKPWFQTEGKLAAVLIIPSSWGSQLDGNHRYQSSLHKDITCWVNKLQLGN
jgi:hypothetical protein